ncbi:MAG: succinate dehydrogenase/fumarate reductase iron-sulfur subunit [Halobacteriovoraceae bacterium]|nr:succinate dehydrogenase/fumarate reductase iron-sulfur subunit [Halobacteriovoraceae bacterium]|tara:strand:- start:56379 stop:57146 length:768 start_codon:yes stop_codon:yes gene_type:complete
MSAKEEMLTLNLKIWRQEDRNDKGRFVDYKMEGVSTDSSFLEMIDMLNDELVKEGKDPVSFDHDCREGICGSCAMMVNGQAHGPNALTTTCQLHMRSFTDGDTIVIEPWRSRAFPVLKDLKTDRSAFDKIIAAGGYISVNTGNAQDANNLPVSKENADLAMDAASCIGCGACVAACPNASAMLFTSAKISQLAQFPQGQVEAAERASNMVREMDELGFGNCTNHAECEAACPKGIDLRNIAHMNREFLKAKVKGK